MIWRLGTRSAHLLVPALLAHLLHAGADPDLYFPYFDSSRRLVDKQPAIRELLYGQEQGPHLARGALRDPSKPLLFTMARLDRVKNLAGASGGFCAAVCQGCSRSMQHCFYLLSRHSVLWVMHSTQWLCCHCSAAHPTPAGLVEWYAACPRLRAAANLVVVGGIIDPAATSDTEEREQCVLMHDIMDRWAGGGLAAGVASGAGLGLAAGCMHSLRPAQLPAGGPAEGMTPAERHPRAQVRAGRRGEVAGGPEGPGHQRRDVPFGGGQPRRLRAAGAVRGLRPDGCAACCWLLPPGCSCSGCLLQASFGSWVQAAPAVPPPGGAPHSAPPACRRPRRYHACRTSTSSPEPAVVEAMSCGLPTFATCHGGPSEIIHHGRSGFSIDPYKGAAAAAAMADFLER